ncbi:hydrophobic surface binding protein A domain-containing protein [Hirsutella rhossiliensis]|uniref:Hydrophobic surface binding protein A domain-containing protein n=1 Tax=Hirsutella rhossiliensis TaxID=111463 RepID=A0A9P8N513_9HYPO|nr:hydrophobic surface binding protein A domain-containing protein [Hirsutella rhossiliensis]KAH0968588.1 hydrophobic surface binding protein A domain-containing protein [Hirsutella rhossiliensis]
MVSPNKPLVLFLAAVSAAPLEQSLSELAVATIKQVNQDVTNIDTNVKRLTRLLAALSNVYLALAGGAIHSGQLPRPIPIKDLLGLVEHVNKTLAIDNPIAVNTLISKKKELEDAKVAGFLVPRLEMLLAGHEAFSNHILARVPADASPEIKAQGKAVVEVISDALRKVLRLFGLGAKRFK